MSREVVVRAIDKVAKAFAYLGSVGMFVMMGITVLDVIMRYLIRHTLAGAPELAEFLMIITIYLVWGFCAVRRSHVSVSILVDRFSPRLQRGINLCVLPPTLFIYALMAWRMLVEAGHQRGISTVLRIPKAPFFAIMGIGVVVLCLGVLKTLFEDVKSLKSSQRS